jgi:hypothetical protein|tara:strand:- start:920 stop:1267 length:348 start_codon:yes stop_codon:yes gene_type:complete
MDPNTGVHASHLYSRGIIMNAQTQPKMTMFYFDSLEKIRDYDSFRVKAVYLSHSEPQRNDTRPNFYSVIGHLRPGVQFQYPEFPVADFPCESYARMFAELCEQYIKDFPAMSQTA